MGSVLTTSSMHVASTPTSTQVYALLSGWEFIAYHTENTRNEPNGPFVCSAVQRGTDMKCNHTAVGRVYNTLNDFVVAYVCKEHEEIASACEFYDVRGIVYG